MKQLLSIIVPAYRQEKTIANDLRNNKTTIKALNKGLFYFTWVIKIIDSSNPLYNNPDFFCNIEQNSKAIK